MRFCFATFGQLSSPYCFPSILPQQTVDSSVQDRRRSPGAKPRSSHPVEQRPLSLERVHFAVAIHHCDHRSRNNEEAIAAAALWQLDFRTLKVCLQNRFRIDRRNSFGVSNLRQTFPLPSVVPSEFSAGLFQDHSLSESRRLSTQAQPRQVPSRLICSILGQRFAGGFPCPHLSQNIGGG